MTIIASSSFASLALIEEETYGEVPASGSMRYLPFTGETLQFTKESITSNTINSSRQISDEIQTGFDVSGGIDIEIAPKTYDHVIEAAMWNRWGTATDVTITGTIDNTAKTITAASGTPFTNLVAGQFVQLLDTAESDNEKAIVQIDSVTDTVITYKSSYDLTDETSTVDMNVKGCMIRNPSDGASSVRISWFIEKALADLSPVQRFSYSGCMVNGMTISAQARSILTGNFDFFGQTSEAYTTGTKSPDTIAASVGSNILNSVSHVAGVRVNGEDMMSSGIYFQSLDFTLSNGLRGVQAIGQAGNVAVNPGLLSVSGNMNTYFADDDMYSKFVSGEEFTVSYSVVNETGEGYVFYFPRATISSGNVSASGNDQDMVENMTWRALMDETTSTSLQIDRFQADYSTAPDAPTVYTGA